MLVVNRILSLVFIAIGIVLIIETAAQGADHGFPVGYVAGAVFIALGVLRRRALRPPGPR